MTDTRSALQIRRDVVALEKRHKILSAIQAKSNDPVALALNKLAAERDRLRTANKELIAALKDLFRETNQHATGDCKGLLLACKNASAIIAKATT